VKKEKLAKIAADIVISYLSNGKKIPVSDVGILVGGVCDSLSALRAPIAPAPPRARAPRPERWKPAVAVYKSVRPDVVICLICGKERLTLRRHLGEKHGMSPELYRERFNLADDHPLESPAYTRVRSDLAKARGLGKRIKWLDRPRADPDRRRKRRDGL
jgi:predicted transcriptional regulator